MVQHINIYLIFYVMIVDSRLLKAPTDLKS